MNKTYSKYTIVGIIIIQSRNISFSLSQIKAEPQRMCKKAALEENNGLIFFKHVKQHCRLYRV